MSSNVYNPMDVQVTWKDASGKTYKSVPCDESELGFTSFKPYSPDDCSLTVWGNNEKLHTITGFSSGDFSVAKEMYSLRDYPKYAEDSVAYKEDWANLAELIFPHPDNSRLECVQLVYKSSPTYKLLTELDRFDPKNKITFKTGEV